MNHFAENAGLKKLFITMMIVFMRTKIIIQNSVIVIITIGTLLNDQIYITTYIT